MSTANETESPAPPVARPNLSFAPSALPPRAVEMLFVPHQRAAQIIIERVASAASSARKTSAEKPRHLLFHGPCGVGKSHLMALARGRITQLLEKRPELRTRVCLAVLPEEQYGISTVGDLMSAILSVVRGWRADGRHNRPAGLAAGQIDAMTSMEIGLEADRSVRDFVGNRLLVVLLENFDEMVVDMDEGEDAALANLLERDRSLLVLATCREWPPQGEPEPVLLSAEAAGSAGLSGSPEDSISSIVLEETTDDAPREDPKSAGPARSARSEPNTPNLWEKHFEAHALTAMLDSESAGLLARATALSGDKQLPVTIASPEGRARVAAARALLGGNPRVVVALGRMMTADTTEELEPLFLEMMDKLASHRRERLWGCSPTDRHLVEVLLNRRAPMGLAELAKAAQITAPTATSHLVALARRGLVRESEGRRQESEYQAGDPLMRLYAGITRAREEPIGLLVEFLRTLFSRAELAREVGATAARGGETSAEFRHRHYTAALVDADEQAQVSEHEHLYRAYRQAFDRRDYEAALKAAEDLVTQRSQSADWGRKGRCLSKLRRSAEALACFEKAVELAPDRAVEWYNRGGKLAELGRIDEAVDSYDRALALERDNSAAWYNRGVALEQLHRWNEALRSYEEALRLAPGDPLAWNNKGMVLARLHRFGEAAKAFDQALKAAPRLAQVWNNRALALAAVGRLETSLTSFDQVLALRSELAQAWSDRGEVLRRLGRGLHALESLEHAVRLAPSVTAYQHLRTRLQVEVSLAARRSNNSADAHRQLLAALDALVGDARTAPEHAAVERLLDAVERFAASRQRSAIGDELPFEERARLEPLLSALEQADKTPTLAFAPPPPPPTSSPTASAKPPEKPADTGFEEVPESSDAVAVVHPVRRASELTVPTPAAPAVSVTGAAVGGDSGFEELPPEPVVGTASSSGASSASAGADMAMPEDGMSSEEVISAAGVILSEAAARAAMAGFDVVADGSPSTLPEAVGSVEPTPAEPRAAVPLRADTPRGEFEELPADEPSPLPADEPSPLPADEPSPLPADEPSPLPADEPSPPPTADANPDALAEKPVAEQPPAARPPEGSYAGSTVELARFKEVTSPRVDDGEAGGSTMLEIPKLSDEAVQSAANAANVAATGPRPTSLESVAVDPSVIEAGLANLRDLHSMEEIPRMAIPLPPASGGSSVSPSSTSHSPSPAAMPIGMVDTIPVSGEFRLADILREDDVPPLPPAAKAESRSSSAETAGKPARLPTLPEPMSRNRPSPITAHLVARLNAASSGTPSAAAAASPSEPPPTAPAGVSEVYIRPLSEEDIPVLPSTLTPDAEAARPPTPPKS